MMCCGVRKHSVTFEEQVRQTMHKSHQISLKHPSYGNRCILQHLPLQSAPVPAATGIVAAGFYARCLKFTTMMRWQKQASSLSSDGSTCAVYSTGWVHITWTFSEKKTRMFCMREWEGKSKRQFYRVVLHSLQDVSVWTVTIMWPSSRTAQAISAS